MRFTYQTGAQPLAGYTIQRGIHRGGFGEVYFARSHGGKEVALKLLHQQDQDIEIRGVSHCLNLKHPNLVNLFDLKSDSHGDHWVVMEYVSGSSLEDVLASFPNGLPLPDVAEWLRGLAAGVAFLHDRGIVHRDLKPSNVYCENGVVKIGDVGLSKQLEDGRRQHTQSVGTVYYMAPEVAKGQYGPEVDVYSLGVMLYEMISGKLPFNGETTAEILMKHLTAQPDLSPIPGALRPTLARALEKDPAQRTPGVRQLEQDFLEALATIDLKTVLQPTYVPPPVRPGTNGHHVDVAATRNGRPQRPQAFATKSKRKCRSEKLSPVIRPWKEQVPELTMSLGFAAVVASVLSAGIYGAFVHVQHSLHGTGTWHPLFPNIENGVQFAAVSVVGSWLTLIGYAWSVSSEERFRRRWLVRITIGALIGTCAFALHRFLMVDTPSAARISRSVVLKIGHTQLSDTTNPFWIGYACFFAFWMGIRTWSIDMHPNRQDQFTVARTAAAIGMAYVASIVFDFPQLYAMLWAGMISTTVQLSSKWNPKPRTPMEG